MRRMTEMEWNQVKRYVLLAAPKKKVHLFIFFNKKIFKHGIEKEDRDDLFGDVKFNISLEIVLLPHKGWRFCMD